MEPALLCRHCFLPIRPAGGTQWVHPSLRINYNYFYCSNALTERGLPRLDEPETQAEPLSPYMIEELGLV